MFAKKNIMTFPDLIKNLLDSSKERLKTPIVGSFILSFLFYNWRVLALLFFSKATIEDRIIVINHEYLGFLAYFWPFIIALGYSLGVPYLMKWIDQILVGVKEVRRQHIYNAKDSTLRLKIKLADKELELQDKISRNKDKQELLDKISEMESDKSKILMELDEVAERSAEYQRNILDLNSELNNFVNLSIKDSYEIMTNLSDKTLSTLKTLDFDKNKNIDPYLINDVDFSTLTFHNIFVPGKEGNFKLSVFGNKFMELLKDEYQANKSVN